MPCTLSASMLPISPQLFPSCSPYSLAQEAMEDDLGPVYILSTVNHGCRSHILNENYLETS